MDSGYVDFESEASIPPPSGGRSQSATNLEPYDGTEQSTSADGLLQEHPRGEQPWPRWKDLADAWMPVLILVNWAVWYIVAVKLATAYGPASHSWGPEWRITVPLLPSLLLHGLIERLGFLAYRDSPENLVSIRDSIVHSHVLWAVTMWGVLFFFVAGVILLNHGS